MVRGLPGALAGEVELTVMHHSAAVAQSTRELWSSDSVPLMPRSLTAPASSLVTLSFSTVKGTNLSGSDGELAAEKELISGKFSLKARFSGAGWGHITASSGKF